MATVSSKAKGQKKVTEDRNGYVTWKGLLTMGFAAASVSIAAMSGVMAWSWEVHQEQPHVGAISRSEYTRDQDQLDNRLGRIENKLDTLLKRP